MTKAPPLKSLNNRLNDLAERFWPKNRPFVQAERCFERYTKTDVKSLTLNNYRLNAPAVERLLLEGSVRSER
jgi:hypothetical protein